MIETLKKRRDFLRLRGGVRSPTPVCVIEAKPRERSGGEPCENGSCRFGFTVTKKLGNAVQRNRIRRRLKSAIQHLAPHHGVEGFDYVIVARKEALTAPWEELLRQVRRALQRIERAQAGPT